LRDKLAKWDEHATELETKLNTVEQQSQKQAQEVIEARNDLSAVTIELTQAKKQRIPVKPWSNLCSTSWLTEKRV